MKRLVKIAAVAALIVAAIAASIPLLFSSESVKSHIADQFGEWTGRKVTLRGTSSISYRPFLGIEFTDVTVANADGASQQPLLATERIRARLNLLPALFGKTSISNFELIRPVINLEVDDNGYSNWKFSKGQIGERLKNAFEAIETTRTGDSTSSTNAALEDLSLVLGNFKIADGIVNYNNLRSGTSNQFTGVNMKVTVPDISSEAQLSGDLVWRGEPVKLAVTTASPLKLLASGTSRVDATIRSTPANADFSGDASFTSELLFKGTTKVRSSSMRKIIRWTGRNVAPGSTFGVFELDAEISGNEVGMAFSNAVVSLDGNVGKGDFQIERVPLSTKIGADEEEKKTSANEDEVKPEAQKLKKQIGRKINIAGALAFEELNLTDYWSAANSTVEETGETEPIAGIEFLNELGLDIRLSSVAAKIANIGLNNLAATLRVVDGQASIELGDAELFGGNIQGELRFQEEKEGISGEARLNLYKVNLPELTKRLRHSTVLFDGKGDAEFSATFSGASRRELIQKMNGNVSLESKNGFLRGVKLTAVTNTKQLDQLRDATKILEQGATYDDLQLSMFIANGIAVLENSQMTGPDISLSLGGKADIYQNTIAMRGRINLMKKGSADTGQVIPFLIGGQIDAPLIAPNADDLAVEPNFNSETEPEEEVVQ